MIEAPEIALVAFPRWFGAPGTTPAKASVMPGVQSVEEAIAKLRELVPDSLLETFFGNTILRYLVAVAVALGLAALTVGLTKLLHRHLRQLTSKTRFRWDDAIAGSLESTSAVVVFFVSLLVGSRILNLPEEANVWIHRGLLVLLFIQIGLYLKRFLYESIAIWQSSDGDAPKTMVSAVQFLGSVAIWSILLLVVLSTFGVEISALVAGLGVGGVAAALAIQSVLGDMFSAISLYADRPFEVGDFVLIDDIWGYIRHIGWRTTRMNALNGQETIFPNSDLTTSRVHNFTRMRRRRVVVDIGIVYGTPAEQVKAVPGLIEEAVRETENTSFDRSHFKAFGSSSLQYETVYFVESSSYRVHMDALQTVLFGIMDRLRSRSIDIAFPSRSLYIESLPAAVQEASLTNGRDAGRNGADTEQTVRASDGAHSSSGGRDESSDGAN